MVRCLDLCSDSTVLYKWNSLNEQLFEWLKIWLVPHKPVLMSPLIFRGRTLSVMMVMIIKAQTNPIFPNYAHSNIMVT